MLILAVTHEVRVLKFIRPKLKIPKLKPTELWQPTKILN